jgi:hypothetical protein
VVIFLLKLLRVACLEKWPKLQQTRCLDCRRSYRICRRSCKHDTNHERFILGRDGQARTKQFLCMNFYEILESTARVGIGHRMIWYGLETRLFSKEDIRKYLLDIKHGWTKNAFWKMNNKWRKLCKSDSPFLFNNV